MAVSKQAAQKFDGETFNHRKLNELEVRKQYQIQISNRFAELENLIDDKDINRTWENTKENIKTSVEESLGLHEYKQHKPWLDEEYSGLLDQRKHTKMQWTQDSHSNLARWRNIFSQLFNVHGVNDVRQTEKHTTEPKVPELSAFGVEMSTEKLKSHKSPGIDQIPAELIETRGIKIRYEIHELIISILNEEELPEKWKEYIILLIYKKGDKTDCSNYRGISLLYL